MDHARHTLRVLNPEVHGPFPDKQYAMCVYAGHSSISISYMIFPCHAVLCCAMLYHTVVFSRPAQYSALSDSTVGTLLSFTVAVHTLNLNTD